MDLANQIAPVPGSASVIVAFPAMGLDRTGTATPSRIEGFDRAVPVWLLAAGALLLLIFVPLSVRRFARAGL